MNKSVSTKMHKALKLGVDKSIFQRHIATWLEVIAENINKRELIKERIVMKKRLINMLFMLAVVTMMGCSQTLIKASKSGDLDSVVKLIQEQPYADAARNRDNKTALMVAAEAGHPDVAKKLIEAGASVHALDQFGNTALIHAARKGHNDLVKLLVDSGSNINIRNHSYGSTPLVMALSNKYEKTANLLIEKGADVNAVALNGSVPLWVAREKCSEAMVKTLKEAGAIDNPRQSMFMQTFSIIPPEGEGWLCQNDTLHSVVQDSSYCDITVDETPFKYRVRMGSHQIRGQSGVIDMQLLMRKVEEERSEFSKAYDGDVSSMGESEFLGKKCLGFEWDLEIKPEDDSFFPGKAIMWKGNEKFCQSSLPGRYLYLFSANQYPITETPDPDKVKEIENKSREFFESVKMSLDHNPAKPVKLAEFSVIPPKGEGWIFNRSPADITFRKQIDKSLHTFIVGAEILIAPGVSARADRAVEDKMTLRKIIGREGSKKYGQFRNAEIEISEATLNGRDCLRTDFKKEVHKSAMAPGEVLIMDGYDYSCIIKELPDMVLVIHKSRRYPKDGIPTSFNNDVESFIKGVKMDME